MPIETKLTITADCEECGHTVSRSYRTGEWGIDEDEAAAKFLSELASLHNWSVVSAGDYEDDRVCCPACKQREAA